MKKTIRCIAWLLAVCLLAGGCTAAPPTKLPETIASEPEVHWESGYISTLEQEAAYGDGEGNLLGTILRGSMVEYQTEEDGRTALFLNAERV